MTDYGKKVYLVGNWKCNKTLSEAQEFFFHLHLPNLPSKVEVVICPPFPYLYSLHTSFSLGAQDTSSYPYGAYTGAVAAEMIKDICRYVIVGHSERRKYFHETNEDVAKKVRNVLDADLTPILCLDEPYLESQLAFFETAELKRTIVAYEPLAAIGSGTPDTPQHADNIAHHIKQLGYADVPILYGGSVTPASVKEFIQQDNINGVLVGGSSLDPDVWSQLVSAIL